MVLASTGALVVEQAPQNSCCHCLCPWGSPSCLLPLWEALQDQQTQALFKLLSLCWDLECEILCAHFKSRVSVSYSPLALLYSSPIGLQSQMVPELVFLVQDYQPGEPEVGLGPLVP